MCSPANPVKTAPFTILIDCARCECLKHVLGVFFAHFRHIERGFYTQILQRGQRPGIFSCISKAKCRALPGCGQGFRQRQPLPLEGCEDDERTSILRLHLLRRVDQRVVKQVK